MEKKLCFVLATLDDLHDVGMIYKKIHEDLSRTINYPKWPLGIYPIEEDAKEAIEKQELYILKDDQQTVGTVILNHCQDDGYQNAHWLVSASHQEVMVIHTLAIDPQKKGHGYAGDIINSIKKIAIQKNCLALRLDITNDNIPARYLYQKHGFYFTGIADLHRQEAGIPYCEMYEYQL